MKKKKSSTTKIVFPQLDKYLIIAAVLVGGYFVVSAIVQGIGDWSQQAREANMTRRIQQCGQSLGYTESTWYKQSFNVPGYAAYSNYLKIKFAGSPQYLPADFKKCVDET